MKSVGEVMAMEEHLMNHSKALCSLETGLIGFDRINADLDFIKKRLEDQMIKTSIPNGRYETRFNK